MFESVQAEAKVHTRGKRFTTGVAALIGILIAGVGVIDLGAGRPTFGGGLFASMLGFDFYSLSESKPNPYAEFDLSGSETPEQSMNRLSARLTDSELATFAMPHMSLGSPGLLILMILSGVAITVAAALALRGARYAYLSAVGLLALGYLPTTWSLHQVFPSEIFWVFSIIRWFFVAMFLRSALD